MTAMTAPMMRNDPIRHTMRREEATIFFVERGK